MAAFSKCVVVGLTLVALGFIGGSSAWGATGRYGARTVEQSLVQRMKGMVLPKVSFGPPATIVDAIDFFRMASKDFDRSDIPEDRRGFEFLLHLDGPVDEMPVISSTVSASNVSFFKALSLVCAACTPQYAFKTGRLWSCPGRSCPPLRRLLCKKEMRLKLRWITFLDETDRRRVRRPVSECCVRRHRKSRPHSAFSSGGGVPGI